MALQKPTSTKLSFTVAFDGEQADIDIDSNRTVGDLIKHALMSFDVDEVAERCHVAGGNRLYLPQHRLAEVAVDLVSLRLPH